MSELLVDEFKRRIRTIRVDELGDGIQLLEQIRAIKKREPLAFLHVLLKTDADIEKVRSLLRK